MTTPTPEAIEAAARAICAAQFPDVADAYAWNVQFEDGKEEYRAEATAALSAAAPFIAAPLEAEIAALRQAAHIGIELDNHHNADKCPYCTPGTIAAQAQRINVETEKAKLEATKVSAEQKIVEAEAASKANAKLTESLTDQILKQRYLDTLEKVGEKGNLVVIPEGFNGIINLDKKAAPAAEPAK